MFTAAKISIIFQSSKLFRIIVRMMSDFCTFAPIKPRRSHCTNKRTLNTLKVAFWKGTRGLLFFHKLDTGFCICSQKTVSLHRNLDVVKWK